MRCWVVSTMVFADKQIRVRSTQCASNSSQAGARAFNIHQIVAKAARRVEACVFCFIDPPGNSFCFGISGLEKDLHSDDPL